jgi:type III restriction enzyme
MVERLTDAILPDDTQGEPPLLPVLNRYKPIGSTAEVNFKTKRPCQPTMRSHLNQVVMDTQRWEQSAAFFLERMAAQSKVVVCYARNDHMEFSIPYEYLGVSHAYFPDYLVRLTDSSTLLLEIKGDEDNQDRAKHEATKRWIEAVKHWGKLGHWRFHVCRDPQLLEREMAHLFANA